MDKPILFVGQCKQGSNSLFHALSQQSDLVPGQNIRAMVRQSFTGEDYFSNWDGIYTKNARYLLDKSIINPQKYDYHVGSWQHYNHKMIYMIRNIYKVLRSQFLVVLAGEASYQYNIPASSKKWVVDDTFSEEHVAKIMDYNKQKYTHYENIINLPQDVFQIGNNVHFCTFESFKDNTEQEFRRLESFLDIELDVTEYPHKNTTEYEWYAEQTSTYKRNLELFEKYKEYIYSICINKQHYERLSELTNIDFISLYDIR